MAAYGSGHFGHWITDEAGMPAYEYTCNHLQDPAAEYLTGSGPSRDHFHLLGNWHACAVAHNEGYVELFRPDTVGSWLNRYAPERGAYAGGFGFLRRDGHVRSTLYRHLGGPSYRRVWGVGYFRKSAVWDELVIDQVTFIPYGNDPVLVNLSTLGNGGLHPLRLTYVEYWDVLVTPVIPGRGEARRIAEGLRVSRRTRYDAERRLLLSCPAGRFRGPGAPPGRCDPDPPVIFLAAIDGLPVAGFETSRALFFGEGGLDGPAALELPFLAGTGFPRPARADGMILALQREVAVPPRGRVMLAHLYGYGSWDSGRGGACGSATPAGLVERYGSRAPGAWLKESQERWHESLARFEAPEDAWVAREVAWNSYYGQALATFDARTGETFFDRGGCFTFALGVRCPPRDSCQHALALLPNSPSQVRGTIRHLTRRGCLGGAPSQKGDHNRAGRPTSCSAADLFWLLWLIADYVLLYRDRAFVEQEIALGLPSGRKTTIRELALRALAGLRAGVALGQHGLLRLCAEDGDGAAARTAGLVGQWKLRRHGESTLESGLAGVVLPRVAELCRWLGETACAEEAEAWAAANRQGLAEAWNGRWFDRILGPDGQRVGRSRLFLDCQPWVVLAGGANATRRFIVLHEIGERLAAIGPSPEGHFCASRGHGAACDPVSLEVEGPLVWAMAQEDPAVAWEVLKSFTLARHAEACPEEWPGIWSGRACPGPRPGGVLNWPLPLRLALLLRGGDPASSFPIADGHSANQLLFALTRLAGLEADAGGYRVEPRLPFRRFAFETERQGLRWQEDWVEGYVVPQGNDAVEIRVTLPGPVAGPPRVLVDRRPVPARLSEDGRQVSFRAFVRGGIRTEWRVVTRREGQG